MDRLTVPISWKAAAGDSGGLVGYASTFGNVDLGGDVVQRGAFAGAVRSIRVKPIPLLADHEPTTSGVIGSIHDAAEDAHGLMISASFASTQRAQDVRTLLLEGHLGSLSIGYVPLSYGFEDRDGQTVRVLKEVELWETSVVAFPMNRAAVVTSAKGSLSRPLDALEDEALAVQLAQAEAWVSRASEQFRS